jgi:hypothetical protein
MPGPALRSKSLEMDSNLESMGVPASRQLTELFQEAFSQGTGLSARWAAERVQGNRRFDHGWCVPFSGGQGQQGYFHLRWDAEFQRYLATRAGAAGSRPEFIGAILRTAAGKWAKQQSLRNNSAIRLLPTAETLPELAPNALNSSAALFVDAFVLELSFSLNEKGPASRA